MRGRHRWLIFTIVVSVASTAQARWQTASPGLPWEVVATFSILGFDPDTGEQDLGVLRRIQKEFGGVLGLNSYVVNPGCITVGDPVELISRP